MCLLQVIRTAVPDSKLDPPQLELGLISTHIDNLLTFSDSFFLLKNIISGEYCN